MMLNNIHRMLSPEKHTSSPPESRSSPLGGISSTTHCPPPLATNNGEADETHPNNMEEPTPGAKSVPRKTWFHLLQDQGTQMTPAEFAQFSDNDQKMKTHCIAFGGYFYPDLYELAEKVYNVMEELHESEYSCLPKKSQRTLISHAIGKIIVGQH